MIQQHYYIGNAIDIKKICEKKKVPAPQLVISSPPYFDLLNYNDNKKQIGFGQTNYNEYLETICKVFQDCYDVATSTATFWLVIDTFKKDKEVKLLPFDIVNKLKEKNDKTWILKDIIIWDKEKNLPWNANGNLKNEHEYILFFSKGNEFKFKLDEIREVADLKKWWKTYPERYNPSGKAPSNIWSFTTPIRGWGNSKQNHLCPFPFPLVEKIISLSTDEKDWILDPFAGSGSVLALAKEMNRNSVGVDINMDYRKRFRKEVLSGANTYWKKRLIELKEAAFVFANFKETNSRLRKMKIASHICAHLNKLNNHDFVYYTENKPKNAIKVNVLQNGTVPKVEMNNDALNDLIKQAKVSAEIVIVPDTVFAEKLKNTKAYKYKFDKFYEYTSSCKLNQVLKNNDKYEFIYSDIVLKISNN
jgi:DNA modification methylase